MANNFKVGDVVYLRSGSPKMTVSVVEGEKCWCVWFDGPKKVDDSFKAETLIATEPPASVKGSSGGSPGPWNG